MEEEREELEEPKELVESIEFALSFGASWSARIWPLDFFLSGLILLPEEEEEEPEGLLEPRLFLEPRGLILEPAEEEEPEEALATTDDFVEPEEPEPRAVSGPPPPFGCFAPRFILQVYICVPIYN